MFESIRRLLARACEDRALVLVLDDLHWADAPSLRLLEFLASEIADLPLLLVGTYRANELSRQHPLSNTLGGLTRVPHVARLNLAGLSADEVHAVVIAAAGTMAPPWFTRSLHQQSDGNPLFLREIVRFLEQQGVLNAELEVPEAALPRVIRVPEGLKEIEADVVLSDGRFVVASESANADLLWALRCGGGNFGVVTSFLFRTHPAKVLYGGPIIFDIADAGRIMRWYRDFQAGAGAGGAECFAALSPPRRRLHWARRVLAHRSRAPGRLAIH